MFDAGSVFAKLGFNYDDTGADQFERRYSELDRKPAIQTHAGLDVDRRGFDTYNRQVRDADEGHKNFVRGTGRVKSAVGTMMIGGAGVAAAGTAFYALGKGVMAATTGFIDHRRVVSQTTQVIQSTGGAAKVTTREVSALADAIERKTGVDGDQVQSGANMLLTFTNVRNEVGKGNDVFNQATKTATDMSAALGQDMKSSAMQLGKALNDPIKGVTALQRVGVTFTDQQKEQIKTLVESGRTMDAQKMILRELNKEFGGSAKAQASPFKDLIVLARNFGDTVGKFVLPFLKQGSKAIADFIRDAQNGVGAGGKMVDILKAGFDAAKGVVGTIADAFRSAFEFVKRVIDDNRDTIDAIAKNVAAAFDEVKRLLNGLVGAFQDTFGKGSGTGQAVRQIISVLLDLLNAVQKVSLFISNKALPGVIAVFRGFAQTVRGIVKVIAGVLTLNFGEAWDGVKDIFKGALNLIKGLFLSFTAPFRAAAEAVGKAISKPMVAAWDFIKTAFGDMVQFLKSRLGDVLGVFQSILEGASHIPIIGGKFKQAAEGIQRMRDDLYGAKGAADALNGSLPGLISNLASAIGRAQDLQNMPRGGLPPSRPAGSGPGARFGAKVGPGLGGARAFIAGEGNLPEWVISLEGPRGPNIQWAREALEQLTGRTVELHKQGKGPTKYERQQARQERFTKRETKHTAEGTKVNRGIARSVARQTKGIGSYEQAIRDLETTYDQHNRLFDQSDNDYLVEHDDGSVTADPAILGQRRAELADLRSIRVKIKQKIADYIAAAKAAIGVYTSAITQLTKALGGAKGKSRDKQRQGYRDAIDSYKQRRSDLRTVVHDLGFDATDADLDLSELDIEIGAAGGLKGHGTVAGVKAADPVTPEPTDPTTTGNVADPAAIATAAMVQLGLFNQSRADLFAGFGNNFVPGGAAPFGSGLEQAAGFGFFGAANAPRGSDMLRAAREGGIHVQAVVQGSSDDALTFTAGLKHELGAT